MALLLPNLRQVLKYGRGISDAATRRAVESLENWSDELVRRLAKLEEAAGGDVTLPIAMTDVTGLVAALAAKVASTRAINTTAPLSGGGDLSADRTIVVADNSIASKGVVAIAPNDTTKFWRGDATWATIAGATDPVFGWGSDGDATFDGTSVVAGLTPNANREYTLNRHFYFNNLTVDGAWVSGVSGARIKLNGYHIKVAGTLTGGGLIDDNGNNGASSTGGSGGAQGAARSAGWYNANSAGGTGATSPAAGGVGSNAANVVTPWFLTAAAAAGGASGGANNGTNGTNTGRGGGGGGAASAGGNGGTLTQIAASGNLISLTTLEQGRTGQAFATAYNWASGGGGGAYGYAGAGGGGGGASGGFAFVCARYIGTITIAANGGNGGNGASGNALNRSGAGGAGGGGGLVVVIYTSATSLTATATGGTGGIGGANFGGGAGGNGGSGGDGAVKLLNLTA